MRSFLLTLCLMAVALSATAVGDNPHSDAELMSVMAWLRDADGYTYELTIYSAMKLRPKDSSVQHSVIYSSRSDFMRYVNSADESSFMNSNGMYRIDRRKKTIGMLQFSSDTMAASAKAAAFGANVGKVIDSILLLHAHISSKKKNGDLITYKLSYDVGYMIKELELSYNVKRHMLQRVSYTLERYLSGVQRNEALLRQTIRMDQYAHQPPPGLAAISESSRALEPYLRKLYPDYTIQQLF